MKKIGKFIVTLIFFPILMGLMGAGSSSGGNLSTDSSFGEFVYSTNNDLNRPSLFDKTMNNRVPSLDYATDRTRINSPYGWRYDPISGKKTLHNGTDFACRYGDPIYASASGKVTKKYIDIYGSLVLEIEHAVGISTRYLHMQKFLVDQWDYVSQGDTIAECGSSGYSTGAHLHLGLKIDGELVDITPYLP